jgi:hypothetical protein
MENKKCLKPPTSMKYPWYPMAETFTMGFHVRYTIVESFSEGK